MERSGMRERHRPRRTDLGFRFALSGLRILVCLGDADPVAARTLASQAFLQRCESRLPRGTAPAIRRWRRDLGNRRAVLADDDGFATLDGGYDAVCAFLLLF